MGGNVYEYQIGQMEKVKNSVWYRTEEEKYFESVSMKSKYSNPY